MYEEPFATFQVDVSEIIDFGQTVIGHRRMVPITGGTVNGQIGRGIILSGTDWQWLHEDGTISLDAHYSISLETGELIEVESRGLRVMHEDGNIYFRTSIRLTTGSNRPEINQRLFTSLGKRLDNMVILELYPVA